jgi:Tol biopolymer transport system component
MPADRLDSWKEIATYLGVSERTARRYEIQERLPVHRHQHEKRGSVYAVPAEIDAWREERRVTANPPEKPRRKQIYAAAAVLAVAALFAALLVSRRPAEGPLLPRPFATTTASEYYPNFSPDGRAIVYAAGADDLSPGSLWVRAAGGETPEKIFADAAYPVYSPVWSPGGSEIAFLRQPPAGMKELWILDRESGRAAPLPLEIFAPPVRDLRGPQIAWRNDRELIVPLAPPGEAKGLFLYDRSTRALRRLTTTPADHFRDASPHLHRDGRTLAFLRERQVYIRRVCLLDLEKVSAPRCLDQLGTVANVTWGAGRELIVSEGAAGEMRLARVNPETEEAAPLALLDATAWEVQASPDGRRLAYTSLTLERNLWLFDARDGKVDVASGRKWRPSTRSDSHAVIAPDGKTVAFSSTRDGGYDVWVASLEGDHAPRRLTKTGGTMLAYAWSPDAAEVIALVPHGSGPAQERFVAIPIGGGPPRTLDVKPEAKPCESEPGGVWKAVIQESAVWLAFDRPNGERVLSPPISLLTGLRPACTPDGRKVLVTRYANPVVDVMLVDLR